MPLEAKVTVNNDGSSVVEISHTKLGSMYSVICREYHDEGMDSVFEVHDHCNDECIDINEHWTGEAK